MLVEREAEEVLARAHARANRVVAESEEQRQRMRSSLARALSSLDAEADPPPGDLISDLSPRLLEATEPSVIETPDAHPTPVAAE